VNPVGLSNAFIREFVVQDVDLVDLRRADPLILKLVAEEGTVLFEAEPGLHDRFCSLAARRYADTRKFRDMERREIPEWLARYQGVSPDEGDEGSVGNEGARSDERGMSPMRAEVR